MGNDVVKLLEFVLLSTIDSSPLHFPLMISNMCCQVSHFSASAGFPSPMTPNPTIAPRTAANATKAITMRIRSHIGNRRICTHHVFSAPCVSFSLSAFFRREKFFFSSAIHSVNLSFCWIPGYRAKLMSSHYTKMSGFWHLLFVFVCFSGKCFLLLPASVQFPMRHIPMDFLQWTQESAIGQLAADLTHQAVHLRP